MSDSVTDPVTGLQWVDVLHERFLSDHFESRSGKTGVIVLDIDGSSMFTERYGADAADALVRHVVSVLQGAGEGKREIFRFSEACRLEGMCLSLRDEFAIEVFDADPEPLSALAGGLNAALEATPFEMAAGAPPLEGPITVSIGHAVFPNVGTDIAEVLEKNWRCVLRSKAAGRGVVTRCEEDDPA